MRKILAITAMLLLLIVGFASAMEPMMITPNNASANQLGGAYNAYEFANGDDTFRVFTVVPLTVQDIVFPLEFWYSSWYLSWLCLILGILMTVFKDRVPSMAIVAFGLLAFGGFLICAFMLPYTASMFVTTEVIQNVDKLGVATGNNTVYITQVADYRASPVHAWICYGMSMAAFIMTILGTLSYIGWFHRKGFKEATRGKYIETDVDDDEPRISRGQNRGF